MAVETYDWSTSYTDEQSGGTTTFTSTSGDTLNVTVSQPDPLGLYVNNGDGFETDTQGGQSSGHLQMEVDYSSNTTTTTTVIDFANNTATGEDSVSDLSFTLYDLDSPASGNYQDQVTIYAYDANGNLLPVTLTAVDSGVVSVSGSTATAILGAGTGGSQPGNVDASSTEGNVQVQISGDVSQLVIVYGDGPSAKSNPTSQQIGIGDMSFSMTPTAICFARGTMILTPDGEMPVEDLSVGDLVMTADAGAQPLQWIGQKTVNGKGFLAPIRFAKGSIGNSQDLLLSPQHRVVLNDWRVEYYTGYSETLVAAKSLVNGGSITYEPTESVEYFHLMLDRHEILFANGAACESLFISQETLRIMGPEGRREIRDLFPEIYDAPNLFGKTARPCLRQYEVAMVA